MQTKYRSPQFFVLTLLLSLCIAIPTDIFAARIRQHPRR